MSDWLEIHALADGHLEGEERKAAERKLAADDQLQAEYDAVSTLKQTLACKCASITCDETLRKAKLRLEEIDRAKRVNNFVGKYSWALCGVFFMAILGAATLNRVSGSQFDPADVARVSSSMSPIPLPGGKTVDAKSKWIDDLFGVPAPVRPSQLQISSVAKGVFNGYQTLRFDLTDKGGNLALFVIAGNLVAGTSASQTSSYAPVRVQTTNGLVWAERGYSFLLLGDRETGSLVSAADSIRLAR